MTINILNKYIEITKKQINTYMKLVFGKKFSKKYCDIYTQKYINIRYYNYYEADINSTIRKKLIDHLKQEQEELIINNINDRLLIEQMCIFYYYVLYFDDVVRYKDLRKTIEKIGKLRKKILNKSDEDFESELYKEMYEYIKEKRDFITRFESEEFYIKTSNYPDKLNVFRVNLKNNIKFPLVYSEFAIKKAFEMGIVNEDKLVVEYYQVAVQILKDIIKPLNKFIVVKIFRLAFATRKAAESIFAGMPPRSNMRSKNRIVRQFRLFSAKWMQADFSPFPALACADIRWARCVRTAGISISDRCA